MKTRTLGWTGLKFSEIGLGTWAMGGGDWAFSWGPQDDQLSIETIQRAMDLGINWIDTAAIYGLGHSEEVVGKALRRLSPRPLVATKFSRRWGADGVPYSDISPQSIRFEIENSLRRLDIEVIDLYQMHWPRPEEDLEGAWQTVAALVREGKVQYAGVCNFNREQLERILPIHPVASLQPPYSMLRRGIEDGLLEFCAEQQVGVVAYSPMQKGLLTEKYTREFVESLPPDDHRKRDPDFQEPKLSQHLRLVAGLQEIGARHGRSVAELAISWVLRRPEVTSAIVGARKPSQIEQTVNASGWRLSGDELEQIEGLLY
jgi:aryl-alcohol dehydrogenase-like predicted oxidoreductase